MAEESTLFKDHFNEPLVYWMSAEIQRTYPTFAGDAFVEQVMSKLESLELKGRIKHISEALHQHLPDDYPQALQILLTLLGDAQHTYEEGMFNDDWYIMAIAYFVEVYGLDHYDESMNAMLEITKRWSAEFAVRPYLTRYPEKTLAILETWAKDDNEHVRRLVSEGTRTRLPWASRLPQFIENPQPVLHLLNQLKDDSSQYVRRSVANNLNDISKDHPQRVIQTLQEWNQQPTDGIQWITRHALRGMVKAGDADALRLLGYGEAQVELLNLTLEPALIRMGDTLEIRFDLRSTGEKSQQLMIDYRIHFVKANGKTSPKVFKLSTKELDAGETLTVQKRHPIKPITTRVYYAGVHHLDIQVNGNVIAGSDFTLELD